MIIFSAAVSADVSPPQAEDSAACLVSSLNRKNYLSNIHMIIFSAAVSADVSADVSLLPPQAGRRTLRLAW
jgi:hypothetical protein